MENKKNSHKDKDYIHKFYINAVAKSERSDNLENIDIWVDKINQIYPHIENSIDLALDARFFLNISNNLLAQSTDILQIDVKPKYDPVAWKHALINVLDVDTHKCKDFWNILGSQVGIDIFSCTSPLKFMYGTISDQIRNTSKSPTKDQKQNQIVENKVNISKYYVDRLKTRAPSRPTDLRLENSQINDSLQKHNENQSMETSQRVQDIWSSLLQAWESNHKNPISLWLLVIDPDSFENTVLNIFYFSFLLKDGLVRISWPAYTPTSVRPNYDKNLDAKSLENKRFCSCIDLSDATTFNCKDCKLSFTKDKRNSGSLLYMEESNNKSKSIKDSVHNFKFKPHPLIQPAMEETCEARINNSIDFKQVMGEGCFTFLEMTQDQWTSLKDVVRDMKKDGICNLSSHRLGQSLSTKIKKSHYFMEKYNYERSLSERLNLEAQHNSKTM
ncbi:unnamed protein product [Gordionus sp. m RMFG-2023]